jgi:hypothetical protein
MQHTNLGIPDAVQIGLLPRQAIVTAHTINQHRYEGGNSDMYGVFGNYTRWAVVFLIIYVLFFLLVPYGTKTFCETTPY